MVGCGLGIALLPRFTTRARPGVVIKPLRGVRAARHLVALSRPDVAERVAVRTALDLLVDIGAKVSRS